MPPAPFRPAPFRPAPLALAPALAVLFSLPGLASAPSAPSAASLRAQAEAATGRPVHLDPRLAIPPCAAGFAFDPGPQAITIRCPASGWRLVAALGGPGAAPDPAAARSLAAPVIRRGDNVRVVQAGPGFSISVDAIAESAGAPGDRILLRNRLTGARFPATIGADGLASR